MKHSARSATARGRWVVVATCLLALLAGVAFAHWTTTSTPGGHGAAAATSVNAGNAPSVSVAGGDVTVTWAPSTLATGAPVSGYRITRYDQGGHTAQTMLSACNGTISGTSCTESNVPMGNWTYSVTPLVGANWRGPESAESTVATVDTVAPVNHLSVSVTSGTAALISSSLYYRGVEAGSLTIANALTDVGSGPASSTTAALGGTSTGWSHAPSTVSTPSGGPYVSRTFSWAASTSSAPTETITGRDLVGNTTQTTLSFVNDSTAPTAGTISYPDGFQSSRSVSVTFTAGTDSGSGVSSRRLQRSAAPLTNGACGTFGSFTNIGASGPTSPYVDTTVTTGACYKYRYVVRDAVGNQDVATSASIAKVDYAGAVTGTSGGLGMWRLGESLLASDTFTGTSGTPLTSHAPEIGSTWTNVAGTGNAQISSAGRAFKSGGGFVLDSATSPSAADYAVEADVVVRSTVNGDFAGVFARQDNGGALGAARYYTAGFKKAALGGTGTWTIMYANGLTVSTIASGASTTLNDFWEYRLRLEVTGTSIKLYVNGVLTASGTSSALSSAGKAGIVEGDPSALIPATTSDSSGMHLDNFLVTPRAADSKGSNTGDYFGGVVLGQSGALANDANTAARYDGLNDYTTVARQISDDFTIEFWFNSTQGIGTGTEWWSGAGLVDAEVGGAANDFGVSLRADGKIIAGVGSPDVSLVSSSGGYNNGAWHHVVFTRAKATGALRLYVDSVLAGTATGSTASLTSPTTIYFGRIATGGLFAGKLDEVALYTTPLDQATVTSHYQLGAGATADLNGPTGGSVDATGLVGTGSRYSTSTTLSLALAKGSDPNGLATSGNELLRASAPLTNGVCGTYGSYSVISNDPTSPKSDTVADQSCHRYQYVVSDTAGNSTTYTSPDIKVDATAPEPPALAFSAMTNASWSGSGSTNVYYRSAASSGSFTATATSNAASGAASYTFPSLGTNWTATPGSFGVTTYSWTTGPAAPGTKNVTATTNAGQVSSGSPFTLVADNTAPSAGTVSYVNGSTGGSTVSVSFTTGTDGGSGVGTRLLQRASAPFTGITCGTFGSFTTITGGTNPTSPVTDNVAAATCYKYQYVVSDNVGNQHIATSSNVAHTPFGAIWTFDQGSGTTAADSSGNGNTATLQPGAGWVAGKVGPWALNLTGANNSYATATTTVDTSQSYSVAAWVRPSSVTGNRTFVSIDGSAISAFYLQLEGGLPKFSVRSVDNTSSVLTQVSGSALTVNTWYHLVGVHDKSTQTIKLYVNGVLQGSTAFTTPWKGNGNTGIGRGKWAGAGVDFVAGAIDDVRMYDRVLTQAEITQLAQ